VKKPARGTKTGNPGKKRSRGSSPRVSPGGWWGWLRGEFNAFAGLPDLSREFVLLILVIVVGLIMWAWRSLMSA
jgi:hypothetical protein